jgi:hypothetical protein
MEINIFCCVLMVQRSFSSSKELEEARVDLFQLNDELYRLQLEFTAIHCRTRFDSVRMKCQATRSPQSKLPRFVPKLTQECFAASIKSEKSVMKAEASYSANYFAK